MMMMMMVMMSTCASLWRICSSPPSISVCLIRVASTKRSYRLDNLAENYKAPTRVPVTRLTS